MTAVRFQKISPKYKDRPCSVCGREVDEGGGYIDGHPGTNYCSACKQAYKAAQPKTVRKMSWRDAESPRVGFETPPKVLWPKGMTANRALRDPNVETVFASGGRAIVRRRKRKS
jgi:hypothetical protein